MTSLFDLATTGTAAEFKASFSDEDDATDLLIPALTNAKPAERVMIAKFLLDQGADVNGDESGRSPLHVLFAQAKHSFKQKAPLVQRMLEAGADINQRERRGDLPISSSKPDGPSAHEAIMGGGGWVRPKLREMIEARGL